MSDPTDEMIRQLKADLARAEAQLNILRADLAHLPDVPGQTVAEKALACMERARMDADGQQQRAERAEAEARRLAGRLQHAVEFRAVGPQLCDVQFDDESEDRHEWTVWRSPSNHTNFPTLDAAWAAAEQAAGKDGKA